MFNALKVIGVAGGVVSLLWLGLAVTQPVDKAIIMVGAGVSGIVSSILFFAVGKIGVLVEAMAAHSVAPGTASVAQPEKKKETAHEGPNIAALIGLIAVLGIILAGVLAFKNYQDNLLHNEREYERTKADVQDLLEKYRAN
tara:strand:+ start:90 stop:512 length:423 start_codon:yes stop_codon:yes gene_type:complete